MGFSVHVGLFIFLFSALLIASDVDGRSTLPSGKRLGATNVQVTFRLQYHVEFGQGFVISGNTSTLGNWDTTKGILMNYTSTDIWTATVTLAADTAIQFKPVRVVYDTKQAEEWLYGDENLVLSVPSSDSSVTVLLFWCPTPSSQHRAEKQPISGKTLEATSINVTFQVNRQVDFGQGIVVTGSISELGDWEPQDGVALQYSTGNLWTGSVILTSGESFQYKPVRVVYDNKNPLEWAADPNKEASIPGDITGPVIIPVRWTSCPSGGSLGANYIREVV